MSEGLTFLTVWLDDGSTFLAKPHEEQRIDAARTHYTETGRDAWMSIDVMAGPAFRCCSSSITACPLSTPDSRLSASQIEIILENEERENRRALGVWDVDE